MEEHVPLKEYIDVRISALKEYIDSKITDLKEFVKAMLDALEKAVTLAASIMEKRLEGMNEFRAQLKDQQSTFVQKAEHDVVHEKLDGDIRELRESRAELKGMATQKSVIIAYIIAGISMIFTAIGLLTR